MSRVELAQLLQDRPQTVVAHLDVIKETTLEARMLTRQLLGYSGKGEFKVETQCINVVVRSMTQLLRASVPHGILFEYDLANEVLPVDVDSTQVRQVLLNLVTNAAEAIGNRAGTVKLRTYTVELTQLRIQESRIQRRVQPGRFVAIEVSDNGEGMTEDVQQRLFEPYFTTKFSGRGLGLSAVLGIVSGHRGTVFGHSTRGTGTRFEVLFPKSDRLVVTRSPGG